MSDLIKIAVDAMGGDNSPKKIIDGIIHNHKIIPENFFKIFGDKDQILNLINDKIFITITDIQSNKVWFFDSKGEVLTDFPVYGTSSVDLNNVDKDKPLEFICQINSDELVMYQMY